MLQEGDRALYSVTMTQSCKSLSSVSVPSAVGVDSTCGCCWQAAVHQQGGSLQYNRDTKSQIDFPHVPAVARFDPVSPVPAAAGFDPVLPVAAAPQQATVHQQGEWEGEAGAALGPSPQPGPGRALCPSLGKR